MGKINKCDFSIMPSGYGRYKVVYTSPNTFKQWACITSNMPLIDAVKFDDNPKKSDLEQLKFICKNPQP